VVQVPPIADPSPADRVAEPHPGRSNRVAYGLVIAAGASAVASLSLCGYAWYLMDHSGSHCHGTDENTGQPYCDPEGVTLLHRASTMGQLATAAGITSLVALGAGAVFWWVTRTPASTQTASWFRPAIGPTSVGASIGGRF
jgi:hypothetical protein